MADRIVLNTISYHGHGAIENIVPELTARGYKKAFVCSDPDLIKFGVTKKVLYDYSQLIFTTILGYFLFGDIPDGWSFLGYFIIIAMAVLVFLYNNVWHNDSEVKG